ncbi:hypothetical protein FJZ31_04630 [Candidatus Poribacteria bacterium]|nr:hypothetical protein [Candidatus Poribacteria bacterium]
MKEELFFKPRARLLLQLGEQLIRNENIALLELIKNSYDADATSVSVVMKKADRPEEGMILIEDDGTGMDMDIIRNAWMEPGSDYKEQMYLQRKRTEKYGRLPLGEKGIGRFAVHKLGNVIELTTRKNGHREIYIKIDWREFEKTRYLDGTPVNIVEREPEVFKGNRTGTKILIKHLKREWTRGTLRDLYRSINSICSPFDLSDSFHVDFQTDKEEWLEKLLSSEDIQEYSLFSFKCEMEGSHITEFHYIFTPWPTMPKLNSRTVTKNQISRLLKMVDRHGNLINLSEHKIGTITFEGMIFDRDSRILALGVQDKKGLTDYLDSNGGIRVYREGVRVYDYGEPENDWLSLDIRRANFPTKRISNNIIISSVSLNREESGDLIEKANREGFIENDAYLTFKSAVLYALGVIETLRKSDKDKTRMYYGPTPKTEPVIASIDELRNVIEKRVKDPDLKKEVETYLDRIETDYKNINEVLLRSAGAGLNLSVVIHEIEKLVAELVKVITRENTSRRIASLVKRLSDLIEGYTLLIRKNSRKKWDLKKLIEQSVFNTEFRFKSHKITIVKDYQKFKGISEVSCAGNLVIGTIMNIMGNSIWWLEYGEIQDKKVFISISEEIPDYVSLIIADNGPGFALPVDEIIKPFVSAKPDGMGIGLHIAEETMKAHKGKLIFPEWGDFSIPDEFKNGATVVLAFRKEDIKK